MACSRYLQLERLRNALLYVLSKLPSDREFARTFDRRFVARLIASRKKTDCRRELLLLSAADYQDTDDRRGPLTKSPSNLLKISPV